jgi:lipoprotein-releasing system ATP-binding protein
MDEQERAFLRLTLLGFVFQFHFLADEPTGSLDSKSSKQVFEVLRELVSQRHKTVVAVTHDLAMASRMDREIVLMDGSIDQVVDAQR